MWKQSIKSLFSGTKTQNGYIVAASACGYAHAKEGNPCEDAWAYAIDGERVIAIVSDGAGSATAGRMGAVIGSQTLVRHLAKISLDLSLNIEEAQGIWQEAISSGIKQTRSILEKLVIRDGYQSLASFHATLVGVVASPEGGFFFHIGDGVGVAGRKHNHWDTCTISPPKNGRYINETFFLTEHDWRNHLRFTSFTASEIILLMSDGPSSFIYNTEESGINPGFINGAISHLDSHSPESSAIDLAETLGSYEATHASNDDNSLIVIRMNKME